MQANELTRRLSNHANKEVTNDGHVVNMINVKYKADRDDDRSGVILRAQVVANVWGPKLTADVTARLIELEVRRISCHC